MYQNFGPQLDGNKVTFNLFLPDNSIDPSQYKRGGDPLIKSLKIVGDFQQQIGGQAWDTATAPELELVAHPNGKLYQFKTSSDLPEGFYEYKYFVEFVNGETRYCTDPCSKYGGSDQVNENSAFVIGGNLAEAIPIKNRKPPKDLIIYEMMIDDFTHQYRGNRAPLDAIKDKLDYLQNLGINAVEFMPWTAWPGKNFSWGYDPLQFFSVEYRYVHDPSNPLEKLHKLRMLINELHQRNIHVIMDGVFNHVRAGIVPNSGFAYRWLYQNPDDSPFIGNFARGGFFEEFDYNNKCVQEFIRDICFYWLDEFQIDGIRFDFTLGFFIKGQAEKGITRLVSEIKDHLDGQNKENVALILEHLTDNRFHSIDDTNETAATNNWFDPFMFKNFSYGKSGHIDQEILRILDTNRDYAPGKGPVTYIQNHDHSSVVHEVGHRNRWFKTQPLAISLITSPGTVMIHNGQEFGQEEFLPADGSERVLPRPLCWQENSPESEDFIGNRLFELYAKLCQIRKNHPALRSSNFFPASQNHLDGYGAITDKDVVIFHRYGDGEHETFERFIIIINYSDYDHFLDIPFSVNGKWEDLLNREIVQVDQFKLVNHKIPSNWGMIYFHSEMNI